MEVALLVLLGRDHARGRDGWLGHEVMRHSPVEVTVLEVAHALVLHTVRDTDVDAVGGENTVNLGQHLGCVGAGAVSTEDGVECALVNDGIEGSLSVLKLAHVHLLVDQGGESFFVRLGHLLHNGEGDVDVVDVLVTILKHFLGEPCAQKRDKLCPTPEVSKLTKNEPSGSQRQGRSTYGSCRLRH